MITRFRGLETPKLACALVKYNILCWCSLYYKTEKLNCQVRLQKSIPA